MIISPLRVNIGIKKPNFYTLNLNIYRNTHYQKLNIAKRVYKKELQPQLNNKHYSTPVSIKYTWFPKTKRLGDIGNVCCVHQKFFEDALVSYGCIKDDNYLLVAESTFCFGGVDKENPRVEIQINENFTGK
jgi:Holliday junction resolvase RusA-like endonuclease